MFKDSVTPTFPHWSPLFLEMLTEIEKDLHFTCLTKHFFLSFGNISEISCRNHKYFLITPSQARRKEKIMKELGIYQQMLTNLVS